MGQPSFVKLLFVLISTCASFFANADERWLCSYSAMNDEVKITNQHYDVINGKLFGPKIELAEGRMIFQLLENDEVNLVAVLLNKRSPTSDYQEAILHTVLINKKSGIFKMSSYGVTPDKEEIWSGNCVNGTTKLTSK